MKKDDFIKTEEEKIINDEIERLCAKYPEFGLKALGYIVLKGTSPQPVDKTSSKPLDGTSNEE